MIKEITDIEKHQKIWAYESGKCSNCNFIFVKVFPFGINPNQSNCTKCNYLYNQGLITSFIIKKGKK